MCRDELCVFEVQSVRGPGPAGGSKCLAPTGTLPRPPFPFPRPQGDGFPAYFDINLGAADSAGWLAYLQQGLYLDQHTSDLTVELITYNAPLRIFGYMQVDFQFTEGGSIKVQGVGG